MGDNTVGLDADTGCALVIVVLILVVGALLAVTVWPWMTAEDCVSICGEGNVAEVSLVSCSCGEE